LDWLSSILFYGVAYAMVLYLISVGLSVTMGLMHFPNLAHGVFAMAGGYAVSTLMSAYGFNFLLAVLSAVLIVAVASVLLERLIYRPLYGADPLDQILMTIGLIFMSIAAAKYFWGTLPPPVRMPSQLTGTIDFGFQKFPASRTFLIVVGLALAAILWLGFERTRFGAKIRAAVDNRPMAQSVGVNTSAVFTMTFAAGSGLAALGGALGAEILAIDPHYPFEHLVKFLIVIGVGGLGTIRGPFIAALLLGTLDTGFKYFLPEVGAFVIYLLAIAILLLKPRGLVSAH
jgi:branched-chain amino acid transport system permease protein